MGGLFFSLVPSAILNGSTWAAIRHLFREFEEEEKETNINKDGEVTEENDPHGNTEDSSSKEASTSL